MPASYAVRRVPRVPSPRPVAGIAALAAVALLTSACANSTLNSGPTPSGSVTATTGAPATSGAPSSTGSISDIASSPLGPLGTPADLAVVDGITVTGELAAKATPSVSFAVKPVTVTATTRRVLTPGSGAVSVVGSRVKAVLALFKGSDGKLLDSTYADATPQSLDLDPTTTIPGLVKGLSGVQAGSRVLVVIPPKDAFGDAGRPEIDVAGTDHLVLVADIAQVYPTIPKPLEHADGAAVAPVPGLPTVTFDAATGPAVTVPAGAVAPSALVSQLLVEGTGEAVTKGQVITVHYRGVLWKDGAEFDSSWGRKQPFSFDLGAGKVIKGWDNGLVGKTVGSRVLLVIPPGDGYGAAGSPPKIAGTDTLVFVVDILAAD